MQLLNYNAIEVVQILVSIFFSIVFFQSGIDKIIDRDGNVAFFKDHFNNTPLQSISALMLTILTILELTTAAVCFLGFFNSVIYRNLDFIFFGLIFCAIVLLLLLFGQRIAKDYVGAADITIYFILCIITIMSFK